MQQTRRRQQALTFLPFLDDMRSLQGRVLLSDLGAGLSVALLTVPQAMAYALVAGLPLTCGLFAGIFATMMTALFGSSKHVVVGPTNAIAILMQAGISEILFTFYREAAGAERDLLAVQIATQLTLCVGFFQLIAALFRLGRLTQFVSQTVVFAYMAGTAMALIVNQSFIFLGLTPPQGVLSLFQKVQHVLAHLSAVHLPTVLTGVGCLLILLFLRRIKSPIPPAAGMLVTAALIVYFFEMPLYPYKDLLDPFAEGYVQPIQLISNAGSVHGILPQFAWIDFDPQIFSKLIPVAFAIALLGMLETSSVGKSLASQSGQVLSPNQEVFGLSLGNLFCAFVGAMPSAGSPSRSSLNYASGAVTRCAALFSGLFVAVIIFSFGFLISFIPLAALAALLFVTATGLVSINPILICVRATRGDAFVFGITLVSCFFFSVDIAFYIGIALSIIFYLNKAAIPHLSDFKPVDTHLPSDAVLMVDVQGGLFFGASDLFQATLRALAQQHGDVQAIVLRLKYARDLDATTCLALRDLHTYLHRQGVQLLLCSVPKDAWLVLQQSGVAEDLGRDHVFPLAGKASRICEAEALDRAHCLIEEENA